MQNVTLADVHSELVGNGSDLFIKRVQELPDGFEAALRDARQDSVERATGELHRVASVPVAVVEIWLRQGFDMTTATPRQIVARLRRDGLDAFIATAKAV